MRDDGIRELPADQYKIEMELLKAKEDYLHRLIDLPDTLIAWLQEPDNTIEDFDPFMKADEM